MSGREDEERVWVGMDCTMIAHACLLAQKWEWNGSESDKYHGKGGSQITLLRKIWSLTLARPKIEEVTEEEAKTNQGWIAFVSAHFRQKYSVDVRKLNVHEIHESWDSWSWRTGLAPAVHSQFVPTKWLVATGLSCAKRWYMFVARQRYSVTSHGVLSVFVAPCAMFEPPMSITEPKPCITLQESARKAFARLLLRQP